MSTADVDLLVRFLNTVDEESGEDELSDDIAARAWFRASELSARGLTAAEARRVRDALRAAADGRTAPAGDLALVPMRVAADREGRLGLTSDHALGPLLAAAVRLSIEGRWERLKLCDMHSCRYAFYDTSRNRSGRWCSMAVCGNRAKTRAFRERHREAGPAETHH